VTIGAEDPQRDEASLHARVDAAFGAIARVQALMSFHDPASELSRLNAGAHREPIAVDCWTWKVLAEAVRLGDASDGALDVAIAPVLVRLGFLPALPGRRRASDRGSYRDIQLHADERVSFARPLQIDLGGIAKGFAVDRAAETLADAGVANAVIEAGGDLRFVGTPPRRVLLRNPRAPWLDRAEVDVAAPALATSAGYFARRRRRGRRVTPLVDPRSGKPVRAPASISVFAPTAMLADGLTKVVALAAPELTRSLLRAEAATAVVI